MAIKKFFKERLTLLIAVLFPIYMFFLQAPLELFLTNREDFWFNLADISRLILLAFGVAFGLLLLLGMFLPKKLRHIYSAIGVAGGLCIYVQGNFLNLDLGRLTGSNIAWSEYQTQFILNAAIWVLVIAAALAVVFIWKEKALKILCAAAGCVLLMQAITLSTLLVNYAGQEVDYSAQGEYKVTDKDLFTVSRDQNVVVFLLDMFDNEFMNKALEENPELKDTFKDFTFFDNAVGSYSSTAYCVANLLTGQPILNQGPHFNDTVEMAYENTQMFDDLLANDYLLDIYIADGYIPMDLRQKTQNYAALQTAAVSDLKLVKKMYRLAACRFAPDWCKKYIWMDGTEFAALKTLKNSEYQAYSDDNLNFYTNLTQQGLQVCEDKRFKFIHLIGTHHPYKINSNVEPIPAIDSPLQVIDTAKGVLKIASTYIEEMKKNGAYENSTIILLADHGYYTTGVLTNPLMLIKQPNTDAPFTVSQAPVCHYDLHATIMSSLGLNADGKYGKSMFDYKEGDVRERLFYQYNLTEYSVDAKFRLIEWSVDSHDNARKNFRLTGNEYDEYGVVHNHMDNCVYCDKYGTDPVDAPNDQPLPHYQH